MQNLQVMTINHVSGCIKRLLQIRKKLRAHKPRSPELRVLNDCLIQKRPDDTYRLLGFRGEAACNSEICKYLPEDGDYFMR